MYERYYSRYQHPMRVDTMEQRIAAFRNFRRDPNKSLGEFLATYFTLWRETRGGIGDFEASQRLWDQVPQEWKEWVRIQKSDIHATDELTFLPIANFPQLVCRVFMQWTISDTPPVLPMGNPILDPLAPLNIPFEQSRIVYEGEMDDVTSCNGPLRRRRHDDEAGPSRMRTIGPRPKVTSLAAQTPQMPEFIPDLTLEMQPPHQLNAAVWGQHHRTRATPRRRPRYTARMSVRSPSPLPLSYLQDIERMWEKEERVHYGLLDSNDDDDDEEAEEGFIQAEPMRERIEIDFEEDPDEESKPEEGDTGADTKGKGKAKTASG